MVTWANPPYLIPSEVILPSGVIQCPNCYGRSVVSTGGGSGITTDGVGYSLVHFRCLGESFDFTLRFVFGTRHTSVKVEMRTE